MPSNDQDQTSVGARSSSTAAEATEADRYRRRDLFAAVTLHAMLVKLPDYEDPNPDELVGRSFLMAERMIYFSEQSDILENDKLTAFQRRMREQVMSQEKHLEAGTDSHGHH